MSERLDEFMKASALSAGAMHECGLRLINDAESQIATQEADHQASFDLRYAADMRGIKMWQEAHPGKELTWPDHADLVVHLMTRIEALENDLETAKADTNYLNAILDHSWPSADEVMSHKGWIPKTPEEQQNGYHT